MLLHLAFIATALAAPFQFFPTNSTTLAASQVDYTTLRLLLYIETLEAYLFWQGCTKFSAEDFVAAGLDSGMHGNVCKIAVEKEAVAVDFRGLLAAIGKPPATETCEYKFAFTSPNGWVDLAREVGMVGLGAWLGAVSAPRDLPLFTQYLASIATTEARHDAYLRAESGAVPAPTIYDTSIPPTWAFSLVQEWVSSCPEPLGYPVFPPMELRVSRGRGDPSPSIGKNLTVILSWKPSDFLVAVSSRQPLYLAMIYNLPGDRPIILPVQRTNASGPVHLGAAVIPGKYVAGVAFVALTTFAELDSADDLVQYETLAGPVSILMS